MKVVVSPYYQPPAFQAPEIPEVPETDDLNELYGYYLKHLAARSFLLPWHLGAKEVRRRLLRERWRQMTFPPENDKVDVRVLQYQKEAGKAATLGLPFAFYDGFIPPLDEDRVGTPYDPDCKCTHMDQ